MDQNYRNKFESNLLQTESNSSLTKEILVSVLLMSCSMLEKDNFIEDLYTVLSCLIK